MRPLLDSLRQGIRTLRSQPAFTALVVLALGLGIGANTALFSVVNSLLLRPLPYDDPAALVEIAPPQRRPPLAALGRAQSFSGVAAFLPWGFNVDTGAGANNTYGFHVTPNLFSVLGVRAALGRVLLPQDGELVVVLGYDYWRRISGDPQIVGQTLTISGQPHTIVGVLPAGFVLPVRDGNVFVPGSREDGRIVARLKRGFSATQAQAEVAGIMRGFDVQTAAATDRMQVTPLSRAFRDNGVNTILLLQAAVAMVLLITCANVGNLLLVRAAARRKEFAVRAALGAGRARLFSQVITESALLATVGGAMGVLVASWSLGWLQSQLPGGLSRTLRGEVGLSIDATVIAFTAGISIVSVFLFGLAPALGSLRADVISALRETRGSTLRRRRVGQVLVVVEVALAVMLLIGAGLLLKSLVGLQNVNVGFSPDHVLRATVDLQAPRFTTPEQRMVALAEIVERLQGLSGVGHVGVLAPQFFPFGGPRVRGSVFAIQGRPDESARAEVYLADGEYFRAVRIPLLKGRLFTQADTATSTPVAIISDVIARRYWGEEDPVGRVIRLQADAVNSPWVTVVGVVGDVRNPVAADVQPTAYRPFAQAPATGVVLMIRTAGDPMGLVGAVRNQIRAADPSGPESRTASLETAVRNYISPQRFTTSLIGFFAALGLLLAAVGVYGVTRNWVNVRVFEIGMRMALGAQPEDVLRLVLVNAGKAALIGIALGVAGAFGLQRVIASQLHGVSPTDLPVFLIVPAVMASLVLVAALLPARWAAHVSPVVALRHE
jgi:putative ABC transport system permease protein